MSEFMPHFAPVVVLLFLGTVLLIGASLLVLFLFCRPPRAIHRERFL
jgi:hypothetical protein